MSISTDPTKRFARIQKTLDGQVLGCAIMIPAEIVEQYVDNSTETLNFSFIAVPEGILIEIEEVQYKKHWKTKPLTRLYSMTRTALALSRVALLWVLRELLDGS